MTPADVSTILTALIGMLLVMGGGAKWLIVTVDARNAKAALDQLLAREALSNRLQEEILLLRKDINLLQVEKALYLRRIYQLEGFIHKLSGVDIPDMPGWPPI